jgi:hypothetical protein
VSEQALSSKWGNILESVAKRASLRYSSNMEKKNAADVLIFESHPHSLLHFSKNISPI